MNVSSLKELEGYTSHVMFHKNLKDNISSAVRRHSLNQYSYLPSISRIFVLRRDLQMYRVVVRMDPFKVTVLTHVTCSESYLLLGAQ